MNYANQHLTIRNGRIQIIPQGVFPASQTYTPLPNVTFTVSGALGIRLVDALNPAFHGLCDAGVVPRMTKDSDAKKFILRLKVRYIPPCRSYLTFFVHAVAWISSMERGYSRLRPYVHGQS